jgi:hypothetical protein
VRGGLSFWTRYWLPLSPGPSPGNAKESGTIYRIGVKEEKGTAVGILFVQGMASTSYMYSAAFVFYRVLPILHFR